jgi:pimeloyl-ACP methyl ester carboxylesterase
VDWGERSPRWAGVRTELVDVHGTSVALLRAEAGPAAPADAPTQLLVHPMASGAVFWLDVLPALTAYGPVIAPDLPGAVLGDTAAPHPHAVRAEPSARFLRALAAALGLDRLVVHGWSFGGLVAALFAARRPELVERLVLTDPTLPGPLGTAERLGWQTLGRAALAVGPALAGGLVRACGPAMVDAKLRPGRVDVAGLARCSPELRALVTERLGGLRGRPRTLLDGLGAFASAVSAMYVDRRAAQDAVDRIGAPTLLLWGDADPLIERSVIDSLAARRPDWRLHVFPGVGHLPPWEVPDDYVRVVGDWLGHPRVDA